MVAFAAWSASVTRWLDSRSENLVHKTHCREGVRLCTVVYERTPSGRACQTLRSGPHTSRRGGGLMRGRTFIPTAIALVGLLSVSAPSMATTRQAPSQDSSAGPLTVVKYGLPVSTPTLDTVGVYFGI